MCGRGPSAPISPITYLHLPWPQVARAATGVRQGGTLLRIGHDAVDPEHGHSSPQDSRVLYTAEQVVGLWRPYADILRAETVTRQVTDAFVHALRQ
ncbi:hypothetical protein a10_01597 [Streptomyces acidiscabies]|nr:hypothetical protein a10_01597 [Streptomyces acidiscabies]GAV37702.1 hypothetical protein Saa2_00576 [Streptomyces acidiscabies]